MDRTFIIVQQPSTWHTNPLGNLSEKTISNQVWGRSEQTRTWKLDHWGRHWLFPHGMIVLVLAPNCFCLSPIKLWENKLRENAPMWQLENCGEGRCVEAPCNSVAIRSTAKKTQTKGPHAQKPIVWWLFFFLGGGSALVWIRDQNGSSEWKQANTHSIGSYIPTF